MCSYKIVSGEFIVIRICRGEDLITTIENVCRESSFKGASIISAIGSLRSASYVYAINDKDLGKIVYSKPNIINGPIEILNCQGTYGIDHDKENTTTHIHATFTDSNNKTFGGHLTKGYNIALVTIEVTLAVFKDFAMYKRYDDESRFYIFDI